MSEYANLYLIITRERRVVFQEGTSISSAMYKSGIKHTELLSIRKLSEEERRKRAEAKM